MFFWLGYQFGHNDQVETLPYVLMLKDSSLFTTDLFLQSLAAHQPNERTAFVYLLLPFAGNLPLAVLTLHIGFLLLLVAGLLRIAALFVSNKLIQALVVGGGLTLGYLFTLGGVELYYSTFQGGNIATALCAWAVFFFLTKRYKRAAALLALASPFQILVGLNTFVLLCAVMLTEFLLGGWSKQKIKLLLLFVVAYSFSAGIFLLVVVLQKEQAACNMSHKEFFNIVFEFRNAHHFLLSHFPVVQSLQFLLLFAFGVVASLRLSKTLLKLLLVGGIIVLLYALLTETTRFVPVASFQFYILTVWLKFFTLVAVAVLFSKALPKIPVRPITTLFILSLTSLIAVTAFAMNQLNRSGVPYEYNEQMRRQNPEIEICMMAKALTEKQALFVHPFQFSALKYYGERSAYVEFKASLHQRCGVNEWHSRLKEVYGVDASMRKKGFELAQHANSHFEGMNAAQWQMLKSKGVTHAILPSGKAIAASFATALESNSAFTIWQL